MYQALHLQSFTNAERVQSVLVLDSDLPSSLIALQMLSALGVRVLCAAVESIEQMKQL